MNTKTITFDIIGEVNSPYKEKFAIPRQPGLVKAATGQIRLSKKDFSLDSVRSLEQFSHIWVMFIFHQTQDLGWKELIRPPRLGGNKKVGVFASRSTFRPNPLGMSVVKLDKISMEKQHVVLHISGLDLLDKTPIVDIKPYLPYADALPNALGGYAPYSPQSLFSVKYTEQAQVAITQYQSQPTFQQTNLLLFITQVLEQDPRPGYKSKHLDERNYGMRLFDITVRFRFTSLTTILVTEIKPYVDGDITLATTEIDNNVDPQVTEIHESKIIN